MYGMFDVAEMSLREIKGSITHRVSQQFKEKDHDLLAMYNP